MINPIRYRGYYYDKDTGFYCLQSRYYDPETGRFLNADEMLNATGQLNGHNTFAYCGNNPVLKEDSSGNIPVETVLDIASLSMSTYTLATDPTWLNFGFFAWDVAATLIPYAPGSYIGKGVQAASKIDEAVDLARAAEKAGDTVEIVKATDFSDEARKLVDSLDRSSGYTKSSARIGTKIHTGYKVGLADGDKLFKEYGVDGYRFDFIDLNTKTIYELKPNNPRSIAAGTKQLQEYNKAMGSGYKLKLELY